MKTFRIYRLFNEKSLERLIITDWDVAKNLIALVGVEIIISILYSSIVRPEATIRVVDPIRVSNNYFVCEPTSTVSNYILISVNTGYAVSVGTKRKESISS